MFFGVAITHLIHRLLPTPWFEEKLHLAAKARIRRMVAPKKRRTDLEVPGFVKEKWEAGGKSKDLLAELLKKVNFDKDPQHQTYDIDHGKASNCCVTMFY